MKTSQVATVARKPRPYPGELSPAVIAELQIFIAKTCGQVVK